MVHHGLSATLDQRIAPRSAHGSTPREIGPGRESLFVCAATVIALACCCAALPALVPGRDDEQTQQRLQMVARQIQARGIKDPAVLAAMRRVPRHRFVPADLQAFAYDDRPLPIGSEQTISQPYIVALMTSLIHPRKEMRVLEIGTGSGYQAAVLAECVGEVDTIEIVPELGKRADALLKELGFKNIRGRIGDGYGGWPERAPYDAILLTAAPRRVPQPLLDQLAVGGRLVAPLGQDEQDLVVLTKTKNGFVRETVTPVLFVPMTGKAAADR